MGISPEHRARIFDEFYQLRNPERDRNKGTGLGLAIVYQIVQAHDGKVFARSKQGHGCTFVLRLKRAAAQLALPEKAMAASASSSGATQTTLPQPLIGERAHA